MMTVNTEICNAFNQHAATYEQHALIQHEIGERLFERLNYIKIEPKLILDLGCGTGIFSKRLKKHYPKAEIVGIDIAIAMLKEAKKKQSLWQSWPLVNADMQALPFAEGSFDLVFANQAIHWSNSLGQLLAEIYRVMREGACLLFSTLGPDTFKELNSAFSLADGYVHSNVFMDMHHIGDCLVQQKFFDTVVDMEQLSAHYGDLSKLLLSLKAQGVRNVNAARNPGLTGRETWQKFTAAYRALCNSEGKYPLTYEIIYGHAWKEEIHKKSSTETFVPISEIRRK